MILRKIETGTRPVFKIVEIAAALLLLTLMVMTCIDVCGRYFFNKPLYGGFELTESILALLIFGGLPLVTLRSEHITIDIVRFPPALARVQRIVVNLTCAVATGYLGYRLWLRGDQLHKAGETSLMLGFNLGYVAYCAGALMVLTALAFILNLFVDRRPNPSDFA